MSEGMWTAVIGGVAAIVAAAVGAWITTRGGRLGSSGTFEPNGKADLITNPRPDGGGRPSASERSGGATKLRHRQILKEMRNGAVLEEWDGKAVLHKNGVVLLWPQRDTVSGMLSEGFIHLEATGDGKKRWSLA